MVGPITSSAARPRPQVNDRRGCARETGGVDAVNPGDQATWPSDLRVEVERLAGLCRDHAGNTPSTRSYELSLGHVDAEFEAEDAFRELLEVRRVVLFHATRLLPHEREAIRAEGLVVLDESHRSRRLDRVIEMYGDQVGAERLELLRHSGPLTWGSGHRMGRLGRLFGVTPMQAAFDGAGSGMTVFLEHWGGESFYGANEESAELRHVIQDLTNLSRPAIVEFAVRATLLNTYTRLWPIFVAQLDGWPEPWHEFSTEESVPADAVLTILDGTSERWPLNPDVGSQP